MVEDANFAADLNTTPLNDLFDDPSFSGRSTWQMLPLARRWRAPDLDGRTLVRVLLTHPLEKHSSLEIFVMAREKRKAGQKRTETKGTKRRTNN